MWNWLTNWGRKAEEDAVGVIDEVRAVAAKVEDMAARLPQIERNLAARLAAIEMALVKLQANPLVVAAEKAAESASPAVAAAVSAAVGVLNAVAAQAQPAQTAKE